MHKRIIYLFFIIFVLVACKQHDIEAKETDKTTNSSIQCPEWMPVDHPIIQDRTIFENLRWKARYKKFNEDYKKKYPNGFGGRREPYQYPEGTFPKWTDELYSWSYGRWFKIPYGYGGRPHENVKYYTADQKSDKPLLKYKYLHDAKNKETYIEYLKGNSGLNGYDPNTGKYNFHLIDQENLVCYGQKCSHRFRPGISYSFWMPSKRYIEAPVALVTSSRSNAIMRPCELGRKTPSSEQYAVSVQVSWPKDKQFSVPIVDRVSCETPEICKNWNAELIRDGVGMISGYKRYFIDDSRNDLEVSFECQPFRRTSDDLNAYCRGKALDHKTGMYLNVIFPSAKGVDGTKEIWKENIAAAIDLLKGWEIKE